MAREFKPVYRSKRDGLTISVGPGHGRSDADLEVRVEYEGSLNPELAKATDAQELFGETGIIPVKSDQLLRGLRRLDWAGLADQAAGTALLSEFFAGGAGQSLSDGTVSVSLVQTDLFDRFKDAGERAKVAERVLYSFNDVSARERQRLSSGIRGVLGELSLRKNTPPVVCVVEMDTTREVGANRTAIALRQHIYYAEGGRVPSRCKVHVDGGSMSADPQPYSIRPMNEASSPRRFGFVLDKLIEPFEPERLVTVEVRAVAPNGQVLTSDGSVRLGPEMRGKPVLMITRTGKPPLYFSALEGTQLDRMSSYERIGAIRKDESRRVVQEADAVSLQEQADAVKQHLVERITGGEVFGKMGRVVFIGGSFLAEVGKSGNPTYSPSSRSDRDDVPKQLSLGGEKNSGKIFVAEYRGPYVIARELDGDLIHAQPVNNTMGYETSRLMLVQTENMWCVGVREAPNAFAGSGDVSLGFRRLMTGSTSWEDAARQMGLPCEDVARTFLLFDSQPAPRGIMAQPRVTLYPVLVDQRGGVHWSSEITLPYSVSENSLRSEYIAAYEHGEGDAKRCSIPGELTGPLVELRKRWPPRHADPVWNATASAAESIRAVAAEADRMPWVSDRVIQTLSTTLSDMLTAGVWPLGNPREPQRELHHLQGIDYYASALEVLAAAAGGRGFSFRRILGKTPGRYAVDVPDNSWDGMSGVPLSERQELLPVERGLIDVNSNGIRILLNDYMTLRELLGEVSATMFDRMGLLMTQKEMPTSHFESEIFAAVCDNRNLRSVFTRGLERAVQMRESIQGPLRFGLNISRSDNGLIALNLDIPAWGVGESWEGAWERMRQRGLISCTLDEEVNFGRRQPTVYLPQSGVSLEEFSSYTRFLEQSIGRRTLF